MLIILVTTVNLVSSQQPCGDGLSCKCINKWIICDNSVNANNILDILPAVILAHHNHLIIHSTQCENFKGLTGLLSLSYPHVEVMVPKQCTSDLHHDFDQDKNDYHYHDDYADAEMDLGGISTRNPASIISLILTGIILISLSIHIIRTRRIQQIVATWWQRIQIFKVIILELP